MTNVAQFTSIAHSSLLFEESDHKGERQGAVMVPTMKDFPPLESLNTLHDKLISFGPQHEARAQTIDEFEGLCSLSRFGVNVHI